jgi:CheY-like chemotaxis protein
MIKVCYYKRCGVVYGEEEPLSDKTITHGLCPKHHEMSLKERKAEIKRLKDKAGGFKILIVEDSTLFRQLLKETLHDRFPSIGIYQATDGEEALQKVETFLPDLIFMDIRIPGGNGLNLSKRIKSLHPNIIVTILTAYDLPEYREGSKQYADYFFSKGSLTTKNILTLVQSILTTTG